MDGAYPLYGAMELAPAGELDAALAARGGLWGAVVDEGVLARLDVSHGAHRRLHALRL